MCISVLVYTLNEEVNLPTCLDGLRWCDDVVVVDSFSTDGTREIAERCGARFVQHKFTGFGAQRNWSLQNLKLKHKWALILDADESVPEALRDEMIAAVRNAPPETAAFRLKRRFHLWRRWLKHSALYPTWVTRLVRVGRVRYVDRGHAETEEVDGEVAALQNDLHDENRKGFKDWATRQKRYCLKDAEYEAGAPPLRLRELFAADPLRRRAASKRLAMRLPFRSLWYFLYAYFWRLGFLDGAAGLVFCLWRAYFQGLTARLRKEAKRRASAAQDRSAAGEAKTPAPSSVERALTGDDR